MLDSYQNQKVECWQEPSRHNPSDVTAHPGSSLTHSPLLFLFSSVTTIRSCVAEEGPVQTDLADFVKSLHLASAGSGSGLGPRSKPRTGAAAGDRRLWIAHTSLSNWWLYIQLVNFRQLYLWKFIYCQVKTWASVSVLCSEFCKCTIFFIWLIKFWYSQERRQTFYASTNLGQTKTLNNCFVFSYFLPPACLIGYKVIHSIHISTHLGEIVVVIECT